MAVKPLIMDHEGMVRVMCRLVAFEGICSPQVIADCYDFSSHELKADFIRGLKAGQEFRESLDRLLSMKGTLSEELALVSEQIRGLTYVDNSNQEL